MRLAIETHVEEHGDGPPIVLLHGFTGDSTTMFDLSSRLDGCGRRVMIDLIGHGKSEAPAWDAYQMDDAIAQVRGVVDVLGESPVLLGYSMGARVALAAAASGIPLRGLITIGGRAGIQDPEKRALRRCTDNGLADEIVERGIDWFVEHWERQPFYASQAALGSDHLHAARLQRLGNSPHALAASLRGMGAGAQESVHDRLPLVDAPALILQGELDVRSLVYAYELVDGLANARLSMVPIAGHATHIEAPEITARRIRGFLTEI
jgi:2-succinyl-6-hydroxy-2,4-cyclohexadiene-1-carboxylate synthase